MITEVKLIADYVEGKPFYEMVPAQEVAPNRFQILASPGFAPGVASGDIIKITSDKRGFRVIKRSGNVCVQLFVHDCRQDDRNKITDIVRTIGGWLDGGKDLIGSESCLLIYTIPLTNFGIIEGVMSQISEKYHVDRWIYGNAYDTSDGTTPLNWWVS